MKSKFILIDGNALVHRAFHALPPTLTKKDGTLTNAVYGFVLTLLNVIERFQPAYAAAAFDRKEKTFRHRAYEGYKAKRVKAPDELYMQIPLVQKLLEAFEIPIFSLKGMEADDLIGTIARHVEEKKTAETIIVTGDLDVLQLIDENTKVFTLRKGVKDTVVYDIDGVKEKYGLLPSQMIDYKALRGDPSDNLPGVKGIGEKTAIELLKKYQTLDKVYENLSEIGGSIQKKLESGKEDAYLSYRLARIETKIPIGFDLETAKFGSYDKAKLKEVLMDLEFYSLVKRLKLDGEERVEGNAKSGAEKKPAKRSARKAKLDEKSAVFTLWEKPIEGGPYKSAFDCSLKFIAVKQGGGRAEVVDWSDENLRRKAIKNISEKKIIGFGTKQEIEILRLKGESFSFADDAKVMAYLVDGGRGRSTYEKLIEDAGMELTHHDQMKSRQKEQTKLFASDSDDNDEGLVREYLEERTRVIEDVYGDLRASLDGISDSQDNIGLMPCAVGDEEKKTSAGNLREVYHSIELPLVRVLAEMEMNGVAIDTVMLKKLADDYRERAEVFRKEVFSLCGQEFNLDSSQQLSVVLYEKLKCSTEGIKKGKSGFYSTSAEALNILREKYEVADIITRYRELTKLVSTYVTPLPGLVNAKTGRLHTDFNQEVTTTGRLSSSNPNLQNIPVRTREGREIRRAFTASPGYEMVSADYSQIELRVAAHYSGDKSMIDAFRLGRDIHTETAARVHGIKTEEVTKDIRRTAKELNFGVIYGMGAYGFARASGIPRQEALEFIKRYKAQFPGVFEYVERAKQAAIQFGYVETLFGRRRYIPEIQSGNWQFRAGGERMAVNMPLQGTAADIMKRAMILVYEFLEDKELEKDVRMLLSVHDEILFEIKKGRVKEIAPGLKRIMESAAELVVPLEVEIKAGKNWGELENFKF